MAAAMPTSPTTRSWRRRPMRTRTRVPRQPHQRSRLRRSNSCGQPALWAIATTAIDEQTRTTLTLTLMTSGQWDPRRQSRASLATETQAVMVGNRRGLLASHYSGGIGPRVRARLPRWAAGKGSNRNKTFRRELRVVLRRWHRAFSEEAAWEEVAAVSSLPYQRSSRAKASAPQSHKAQQHGRRLRGHRLKTTTTRISHRGHPPPLGTTLARQRATAVPRRPPSAQKPASLRDASASRPSTAWRQASWAAAAVASQSPTWTLQQRRRLVRLRVLPQPARPTEPLAVQGGASGEAGCAVARTQSRRQGWRASIPSTATIALLEVAAARLSPSCHPTPTLPRASGSPSLSRRAARPPCTVRRPVSSLACPCATPSFARASSRPYRSARSPPRRQRANKPRRSPSRLFVQGGDHPRLAC